MKTEKIRIKNRNNVTLNAMLDLPVIGKPLAYAMFAHCFTCSGNFRPVRQISEQLVQLGFAVLRFDFTGLGQSEGEFADSHFSANVDDLEDVFQYLADNHQAPELLIGHSLGGAAAIVGAARFAPVKAVVTIGTPATVQHTTRHFSHQLDEIDEKGEVMVNIGGRPFTINKNFVEQFAKTDLPQVVSSLKKPLLILHSPVDRIVDIENAQQLFQQAFHPKSFISLDQADHLLSEDADSRYVGSAIAGWVQRYLPLQKPEPLDTKGEQLVAQLKPAEDGFTTTLQTSLHTFIADEPASVGGANLGPTPYEHLSAGLAACTAMTLKIYAESKKWDLQEVLVYISHNKRHIDDMGKKTFLDVIEKKLEIVGNLDEEQRLKLKEIASKCPVHKTLLGEVVIDTELL
ncbi:MAG: alpha/beta fold hydrolase [Gammaproteobacteria bacterium]|nr:alpha/beta fold hydrolase [Gammaproteobacteria bacterium]